MDDNKFTKRERLSGRTAVTRLFGEGKSGFVYPFRYIYIVKPLPDSKPGTEKFVAEPAPGTLASEKPPVSILVSVSKRYHKRANRRNLLKRRTREAYRQGKHPLADKCAAAGKTVQIAFIYSSKEAESYKTIDNAVGRILAQVAENI